MTRKGATGARGWRAVAIIIAALALAHAAPAAAAAAAAADAAAAASPAAAAPSAPQSYFDLLQVTKMDARDAPTLKRAYRRLALLSHPDKLAAAASAGERAAAQSRFVQLARAFEVLADARLRTRYEYLLSLGVLEYDDSRDWGDFDASQGFKRRPKSRQQRDAEERFKAAAELFKRAQEEAEEFALWTSLGLAGVIAAMPAAYLFFRRRAESAAESGKRRAAASDLRASQAALRELQAEQERAKQVAAAEEREYARQLRLEREAAAAAAATAAAAAAAAASSSESGEWEVVPPGKPAADPDADADAAADAAADSESDSGSDRAASRSVIKCALCNKKFKSQAMMTQHEQSALHQKALKQAERAAKKKSKRDE